MVRAGPRAVTIFDILPCDGTGVTADKIYRPRALMTREQASKILAIAADKPRGIIPQVFLDEATEVMNGPA